jgi:hypothetical protein
LAAEVKTGRDANGACGEMNEKKAGFVLNSGEKAVKAGGRQCAIMALLINQ